MSAECKRHLSDDDVSHGRSVPAASAAPATCTAAVAGSVAAPVSAASAAAAVVLLVRVSLPALAVPSVLVLPIIATAVGCSGLVFKMPLAAAAAEASARPAVPPFFPGLTPGSWVASATAVAPTSVAASTSGPAAEML